jgi:hypothetical protein
MLFREATMGVTDKNAQLTTLTLGDNNVKTSSSSAISELWPYK